MIYGCCRNRSYHSQKLFCSFISEIKRLFHSCPWDLKLLQLEMLISDISFTFFKKQWNLRNGREGWGGCLWATLLRQNWFLNHQYWLTFISPNSCLSPNQGDQRWGLWEVISFTWCHKVGVLKIRLVPFSEQKEVLELSFPTMWEHSEKATSQEESFHQKPTALEP